MLSKGAGSADLPYSHGNFPGTLLRHHVSPLFETLQIWQRAPLWSVVENLRCVDGRVFQRQVVYLGALNWRKEASWRKTVDAITKSTEQPKQVALFPDGYAPQT
jgi:hypothetical protein